MRSSRFQSVRRATVLLAVASLALAACGSDDESDSSTTTAADRATTTEATADTTGSSSSGKGDCFGEPGTQTAKVRFVNLYTNATYPGGDIDIYSGFGATDPCGEKLATLKFGEATDYLDVTAQKESGSWNAVAYVAGKTDQEHQIIGQGETWKGGEVVTILFSGSEPSDSSFGASPASGTVQAFFENGDSPAVVSPADGKAVVAVNATALQAVDADGAWNAGAVGGSGCLPSAEDTEFSSLSIGGTSVVSYAVDPGSVQLGLFPSDPGTCEGTPVIGPATVDAAAGSRTLVFAYGVDAQSEQLLVLPLEGD